MDKVGLILFVLLTCAVCAYTVKLRIWFFVDLDYTESISLDIFKAAPETIWRHLKLSGLLRKHLADTYVVKTSNCSVIGLRSMLVDFTSQEANNIHAFIGPVCSYSCELTGMMSSSYSIPQVCRVVSHDVRDRKGREVVNTDIAVRNRNHHTATGNHMPCGIT